MTTRVTEKLREASVPEFTLTKEGCLRGSLRMPMKKTLTILGLILFSFSSRAQQFYNVLSYGAKADSSAKCTKAIAAAIAAAFKKGGGTVYFPAGKYLTGPIHLKSNITVLIDAGAELSFSDDFDDYMPFVESRFEGLDLMSFSPLFYAYKAENISITGRGRINGNGKKWWNAILNYKADAPKTKWQTAAEAANRNMVQPDDLGQVKSWILRPPFIQPMYCRNVLIQGITIVNSPFWTVNPEFCENVTVDGVTINNPPSPNTDGINPESCRYVHIANCHISVGDDCITIKSGKDKPGRAKAAPAENYTITNCTMLAGHGGVVIGSEMSGDVRKITISNCVFDGTDRGIRIKTARGRGGVVEEIRMSNVVMKNIRQQAVVLDMQYARTSPEPVSDRTPRFRNIHLSNITAQTAQAIYINGLAETPVEDITFNDIQFEAQTGAVIREAANVEMHNVRINTQQGPSLVAENVSDLTIDGLKTLKPVAGKPVIDLTNVQNVFLYNCNPVRGTDIFLNLKGDKTKSVVLKNNNFSAVQKAVVKDEGVKEEMKVE